MPAERNLSSAVLAAVLLIATIPPVIAQWDNIPNKGPKTKDGKPDMSAPTPRAPDGKPDLNGVWMMDAKGFSEGLGDYVDGGLPLQLWAQALTDERGANGAAGTPTARCLSPGIPMLASSTIAHPIKIVQQQSLVVILYEYFGEFRQVFLDGRSLPHEPNPTWLGYSVGRWDADKLIIDSAGFNGKIWLDTPGDPATDALHITERYQRPDYGHLELQMTIDDRQAYTRPWTVTMRMHLVTDADLYEYVCNENERDAAHTR
jgi:hypothetical protein